MVASRASPAGGRAERAARRARRRRVRAARLLRVRHRHADLDRLAAGGLRYSNFHTTALCSPTRACVLTGRNHHACGMGRIVDLATGFPGYDARIPPSCALPARRCSRRTATPPRPSASGTSRPRTRRTSAPGATGGRWAAASSASTGSSPARPTSSRPRSSYDNHHVEPPRRVDDGYHLTEDLVDHAIEFVEDLRHVDVDKPLFLYLATGACHSPHQSPRAWIERYRGRFDAGWDAWREATLRPPDGRPGCCPTTPSSRPDPTGCRRGSSLTADERRRLRPVHGGLRRASCPTPTPRSAGSSTASTRSASSTTRSCSCCPTTARRRRAARPGRSTTCGSGTCCPARSRRPPSGSTRSAGPASTTTTRGAGRSPATRRSAAGSARPTRAASPIR